MSQNNLTIRHLTEADSPALHRCFVRAFEDYHVDFSYFTYEVMVNRTAKNGYDPTASVGVFDGAEMVGFTAVGTGMWQGQRAAFDTGTGLVKAYRGQGLAGKMFDMISKTLKSRDIKLFVLEVLKVNESGIKAYIKSGFEISRSFQGYKIEAADYKAGRHNSDLAITAAGREALAVYEAHLDWPPSWEQDFTALRRIPDELTIFTAALNGQPAGLIAYYPLLGWIMDLVVVDAFKNKGVASTLLNHLMASLPAGTQTVKWVNVLESDLGMTHLASSRGFENYADQYEMILYLEGATT